MSKDELAAAEDLLAEFYDEDKRGRAADGRPCPSALRRAMIRVLEGHGREVPPSLRRPTLPSPEEISAGIRVLAGVLELFRAFVTPDYPTGPPELADQALFWRFWDLAADQAIEEGPERLGWPELASLLELAPTLRETSPAFRQFLATLLERLGVPLPPELRDSPVPPPAWWHAPYLESLEKTGNKTASAEAVGKTRTAAWREERINPHFERMTKAALRRAPQSKKV